MKKIKLLQVASTLDEEELKRLLPFLKSPYFNSNPSIVKLYRVLRKFHPDYSSRQLTKEYLFNKVFPDREFDYHKLHNLFSDFTRLLEKYLSISELQKDKIEEKKLLVRAYKKRGRAFHLFEKEIHHLDQYVESLPYRDEQYFYEKEWLNLNLFGHTGSSKRKEENDTFERAYFHFQEYIKLKGAKMDCAKIARQFGSKSKQKEDEFITENTVLGFYEKLNRLQKNPNDINAITDLSEHFITAIHQLRIDDRNNIIKILQNFCARSINNGAVELGYTSLSIYRSGLENECLLVNGKMTETTFQNIVSTAIFSRELDWAKLFIDNYKDCLDEEIKEDALAIGMGHLHFSKREYREAIRVLQHSFKDVQNQLKAKSLLVRTWFELFSTDNSYFEMLVLQLEAFEKFTRRNKSINSRLTEAYLRFISFSKKIAQSIIEGKDLNKLKHEIEQQQTLVLRNWLIEKVS